VIPAAASAAIRDLERARDAAQKAARVARPQVAKLLLRRGRCYPGKTAWHAAHRAWIAAQAFAEPAQRSVLADGLAAVESATGRVAHLTDRLREGAAPWDRASWVQALQSLRGVAFVTAVTVVAAGGDRRRFATAGVFMGSVGLVPTEQTSGPITTTGHAPVRRVLVESAWPYRRQPRMSQAWRERRVGIAAGVGAITSKAQTRRHHRLKRLIGRGQHPAAAMTAVAREVAGFIWAIGRPETLLAGSQEAVFCDPSGLCYQERAPGTGCVGSPVRGIADPPFRPAAGGGRRQFVECRKPLTDQPHAVTNPRISD
jgi:hypothetical protein